MNGMLSAVATIALLLVVGCGGDDSGGANGKSGEEILTCLRAQAPANAEVSDAEDDLDLLAQNAGEKGIVVNFPRNELAVVVERAESDAEQTLTNYKLFIKGASERQLERRGRSVVAFSKTPNAEELALVDACL